MSTFSAEEVAKLAAGGNEVRCCLSGDRPGRADTQLGRPTGRATKLATRAHSPTTSTGGGPSCWTQTHFPCSDTARVKAFLQACYVEMRFLPGAAAGGVRAAPRPCALCALS
jgi:hypothetical protein